MRAVGQLIAVTLLVAGCASVPPEAPQLSTELGKRISAIEEANITLLHRFFDQKRAQVDRFIEQEWAPLFADEFFNNPTISDAWNTIVHEDDKKQRLTFLVKSGPRLQKAINAKRLELIQPLDDLERRIEKKVRDDYVQARALNNAITSFLLSASKISENRNRYLESVGVKDQQVGKWIDQTDDAVANLLSTTQAGKDRVDRGKAFIEKIRNIRDAI